jgi:hypothetical protein
MRKILLAALLLFALGVPCSLKAQTNVITLNVTGTPQNITVDQNCNFVILRENAATPAATFIITLAGNSTALHFGAGVQFQFHATASNPIGQFTAGQVIGTIAVDTGSATFVAMESVGDPSRALISSSSSSGGSLKVNGSLVSAPNLNGTTPAAGAGFVNVVCQVSGSNVSCEFADPSLKVDKTTTVNGHALSGNVSVTTTDIGAVPTTTTVCGHALSSNVACTPSDVSLGNVTNDAQLKSSQLDTDGTLAANSDTRVASQKAAKTYSDTKLGLHSTADTAAALSGTPSQCTGSQVPTGISANGNASGCAAPASSVTVSVPSTEFSVGGSPGNNISISKQTNIAPNKVWAAPASQAIGSLVQYDQTECTACNNLTKAYANTPGVGNTLVAITVNYAGGHVPSVTGGSNTWVNKLSYSNGLYHDVWVACNANATPTTVTPAWAGGADASLLQVFEIQGTPASSCSDTAGSNTNGGLLFPSTLTVTTGGSVAQSNELVLAFVTNLGDNTQWGGGFSTPGTSWTKLESQAQNSEYHTRMAAFVYNTSTGLSGTQSAVFNVSNNLSSIVDAGIITIKLSTTQATGALTPRIVDPLDIPNLDVEDAPKYGVAGSDIEYPSANTHARSVNNNNTGDTPLSRLRCVYSPLSPSTASANVTTPQNLANACSLPANTLQSIGRTLKIRATGIYNTAASSTAQITFTVRYCSVSGCGSGNVYTLATFTTAALPTVTVVNGQFVLEMNASIANPAGNMYAVTHGTLAIGMNAASSGALTVYGDSGSASLNEVNIADNSSTYFLQVTGAFSAASSSNTIRTDQFIVEELD